MPRLTLSLAGSSSVAKRMPWATKQRTDPTHSSIANPPNNCLQNLTHSGVVGGGVNALGPSRFRISSAFSFDRPYIKNRTDKNEMAATY